MKTFEVGIALVILFAAILLLKRWLDGRLTHEISAFDRRRNTALSIASSVTSALATTCLIVMVTVFSTAFFVWLFELWAYAEALGPTLESLQEIEARRLWFVGWYETWFPSPIALALIALALLVLPGMVEWIWTGKSATSASSEAPVTRLSRRAFISLVKLGGKLGVVVMTLSAMTVLPGPHFEVPRHLSVVIADAQSGLSRLASSSDELLNYVSAQELLDLFEGTYQGDEAAELTAEAFKLADAINNYNEAMRSTRASRSERAGFERRFASLNEARWSVSRAVVPANPASQKTAVTEGQRYTPLEIRNSIEPINRELLKLRRVRPPSAGASLPIDRMLLAERGSVSALRGIVEVNLFNATAGRTLSGAIRSSVASHPLAEPFVSSISEELFQRVVERSRTRVDALIRAALSGDSGQIARALSRQKLNGRVELHRSTSGPRSLMASATTEIGKLTQEIKMAQPERTRPSTTTRPSTFPRSFQDILRDLQNGTTNPASDDPMVTCTCRDLRTGRTVWTRQMPRSQCSNGSLC